MKQLLVIFATLFTGALLAQSSKPTPTGFGITPTRVLIHELRPGDAVTTFDLASTTPDGSPRYFDDYLPGEITLRDGSVLTGFTLDYNIKKWAVEVFHEGTYYEVPGFMVKELTIVPPSLEAFQVPPIRLVNPNEFLNINTNEAVFLEVAPGEEVEPFTAYPGATIKTIRANYVPALDTGSKTDSYKKEDRLFFSDGRTLHALPPGKKAIRKYLEQNFPVSKSLLEKKADYSDPEILQPLLSQLR